jgi:class 3 adenylate cyclase
MWFHVVSRFEGYTAQYLGDGLLMYFGYPRVHADDARRLLHGIVRQFPQGENSLDVQEAKGLLAELG